MSAASARRRGASCCNHGEPASGDQRYVARTLVKSVDTTGSSACVVELRRCCGLDAGDIGLLCVGSQVDWRMWCLLAPCE